MICHNCGARSAAERGHCANCGESVGTPVVRPGDVQFALSVVFGCAAGIAATLVLWWSGAVLADVVAPPRPLEQHAEFYVAPAIAWIYLIELLVVVTLIVLAFTQPALRSWNRNLRAIFVSALFVMLGGMALCNLTSVSSLRG